MEQSLRYPSFGMLILFSGISQSDTDQDDEDNDTSNNQSSQKGAPQYKRLIAIRAGKAKHGVKRALKDEVIKFNRLSLDEHALEKAATNNGKDLVRYLVLNQLICNH